LTYHVSFLKPTVPEFMRLRRHLQIRSKELGPYLEANPFRSYPFLQVKEVGKVPGIWRFHLGPYRVFFKVDGSTLWIRKFWLRPPAYDEAHIRELRRTLYGNLDAA
jgi:mRNA-degrading endonuclease RelE of RelBE toxin-antitoxin system